MQDESSPSKRTRQEEGGGVRAPFRHLSAADREDLKETVVRLSGGKEGGAAAVAAAVKEVEEELLDLKLGEWPSSMSAQTGFFIQRDYSTATAASVVILQHPKPQQLRGMWSSSAAAEQFPRISIAAQKLLAAHVTTAAAERNW